MPRTVNPERRAKKKTEILNAAMQCFAEKGFHSTSMQDVCQAAGMSPGSLYRYFSSKDEIIIAIVEQERSETDEFVKYLTESKSLVASLGEVFKYIIARSNDEKHAQLSVEIYAELLRNEEPKQRVADAYDDATNALSDAIAKAIDRGELSADWDAESLAEILIALMDAIETRPPFNKRATDKQVHKTLLKLLGRLGDPQ